MFDRQQHSSCGFITAHMPITFVLADESNAVRQAIKVFLQAEPGIKLLGEAADFAETLRLAAEFKPDVVLMDLRMPDGRELDPALIKSQLLLSARHVLVMSLWTDEESKDLAIIFGATALLDKSRLAFELIPAIMRFS